MSAEYIYLHWDGDAPFEVVRGHMHAEVCEAVLKVEGIELDGTEI
jgi:hypothetical protein